MNPAHTSDKPGKAPCGMDMEPVYADATLGTGSGPESASLPAGTIKVSLEKQQLIGVRVAPVERKPLSHSMRLLGRVAADETRIYRINATIDGWITKAGPQASGTYVKKDETLATFYSSEFLSAGNALLFALSSKDRVQTNSYQNAGRQSQLAQFEINLKQYADSLRNLGMGEVQLEEMIRTRKYMENVNIVSPADGYVLARNVSDGQRFDKGTELYRIADLSRVWILADVFEKEARLLPPRLQARVSLPEQNKVFMATLTQTLPQFDGVSRTLKLRFEADNPDIVLKPDMFVDVELPITLPEALVVPAEAVLDAGLRKTVFVDRGNGFFEPRVVQTGAQLGNEVQILHGLTAGERIVVSGNFLLDSESRMKLAAAGVHGASATDPVCGMTVDETKARAAGRVSQHQGQAYYFCNDGCKKQFDADPAKYLAKAKPAAMTMAAVDPKEATDPVCGMKVDAAEAKAAKLCSEHQGKMYFFCNEGCRRRFEADPAKYLAKAKAPAMTMAMSEPKEAADPVCGMKVDVAEAKAAKLCSEHEGKMYFFCNEGCRKQFDANPGKYLKTAGSQPGGASKTP
jgi:Cu(I)/Ag(I) efflux system membrane fusion protein